MDDSLSPWHIWNTQKIQKWKQSRCENGEKLKEFRDRNENGKLIIRIESAFCWFVHSQIKRFMMSHWLVLALRNRSRRKMNANRNIYIRELWTEKQKFHSHVENSKKRFRKAHAHFVKKANEKKMYFLRWFFYFISFCRRSTEIAFISHLAFFNRRQTSNFSSHFCFWIISFSLFFAFSFFTPTFFFFSNYFSNKIFPNFGRLMYLFVSKFVFYFDEIQEKSFSIFPLKIC